VNSVINSVVSAFVVFVLSVPLGLTSASAADANWPRWRGPSGDGHSTDANLPVAWTPESLVWKVPLKGSGQSSPIVWGERIFLTAALGDGRERLVFCIDRNDGKTLWEHIAWTGTPEKSHKMNGWASATCVTDGEIVVAFFGRGGLHAYTVDGKHLWTRDLGPFECPWGTAACPVIVGDLVIQNGDADADAFIMALEKKSGKTVWTTRRPDNRGWSTPILITAGDRQELVLNGHTGVTAYDPKTGKELWFCKSFNGRGEPTVTPANGVLCTVNGLSGDIYAVRPGGSGDVTATHMAWHTPRRGGRDTPSPIVIGPYIVVVDMKGVATCYDSASGKEYWKERICDASSSSPIAANGLAYFQDEKGNTTVLKPGPTLELVAKNSVGGSADELFRASLTPSDGQFFSRSDRMLYCIGKRTTRAARQ
jgi:outer membrane protein assembly factor BamB